MEIDIVGLRDIGDLQKERLILQANEDLDVGDFLILAARKKDEVPLGGRARAAYWMPDHKVKKGDRVILYTKKGARSEKQLNSGTVSYFFYWNLENSVWENSIPILIEIYERKAFNGQNVE
ncbi:MAG: hypothetical protein ABSA13_02920 [Beijerinckiaceae bacterium]|jgi:hypothetical protein